MQRFWLFLLTFMLVFNMSVIAYADETTLLAEASSESATVVAEEIESDVEAISTKENVEEEDIGSPVIEPVKLDVAYIEVYFSDIFGDSSKVFSEDTFDIIISDINGNNSSVSVNTSEVNYNRVVVVADLKNLDTTNELTVTITSNDWVIDNSILDIKRNKEMW